MRGRKKEKKLIEELEAKLAEFIANSGQIIANSGQSKDDIHTDYIDNHALKRKIDNPNSCHDDDDIRRMKDLHNAFLLGKTIHSKQNKIQDARKVAATAATATATATSNVANTSISSYSTSADSSASTSINANKITASFESTPPSSGPSSTTLLPPPNDKTRASLDINSLSNQWSILTSHSINKITAQL
jgi:hypothetical protein